MHHHTCWKFIVLLNYCLTILHTFYIHFTIHFGHTALQASLTPCNLHKFSLPPIKFPFHFCIFLLVFVCFATSCISLELPMWVQSYPLAHELSHQWLHHEVNDFLHLRTLKYQNLLWSGLDFMAPFIIYDNVYGLSLKQFLCRQSWLFWVLRLQPPSLERDLVVRVRDMYGKPVLSPVPHSLYTRNIRRRLRTREMLRSSYLPFKYNELGKYYKRNKFLT